MTGCESKLQVMSEEEVCLPVVASEGPRTAWGRGCAGRRLCSRSPIKPDPCLSDGDSILKDTRELRDFNSGFCEEEVAQCNS